MQTSRLTPKERIGLAEDDKRLATLAAMTAAHALIDRVETSDRWALARLLANMLGARLVPGQTLSKGRKRAWALSPGRLSGAPWRLET